MRFGSGESVESEDFLTMAGEGMVLTGFKMIVRWILETSWRSECFWITEGTIIGRDVRGGLWLRTVERNV